MADTVDSGDYTSTDKYRRAIALALLKQGFGQHGRAGGLGVAADAVNGLVSGYMMRGADLDEKEADNKVAAALMKLPGLSAATPAPVVPPSTPGPTNKMPGMSDLIDPADGKPVNAGVVPYAAPVPGGEPVMIGHDSGSSRAGSAFNPYTVRVGEPRVAGGAPIVDRGTGKHAVDYNKNGFGLAYDAPVGSVPSPEVISQLQKEVEAENFRRGNLTPMPFRGHGEADYLHKTGQDPRRATATSRDLTEASWRPYATALHDRSQIGVDPTGSDVRFNYDPATGANNINQFGGAQAPIRVAQAGTTGSLPALDVTAEPAPAATPAAPSRADPVLSPAMRDSIVELMKNRQTRPLGLQMYMETMKAAQPSYDFQVVGDHLVKIDKKRGSAEIVPGLEASKDKPPQGFEWIDKDNKAKGLRAIPGGPGEHIPEGAAGRLAMMDAARPGLAEARKVFERNWGAWDTIKNAAANAPGGDIGLVSGEIGQARRSVQIAIEAGLRMMTGAAAPKEEVASYMDKFMPGVRDSVESAKQKLDALDAFMGKAEALMTRGRSSTPGTAGTSGGGWSIKAVP